MKLYHFKGQSLNRIDLLTFEKFDKPYGCVENSIECLLRKLSHEIDLFEKRFVLRRRKTRFCFWRWTMLNITLKTHLFDNFFKRSLVFVQNQYWPWLFQVSWLIRSFTCMRGKSNTISEKLTQFRMIIVFVSLLKLANDVIKFLLIFKEYFLHKNSLF